MKLHSVNSYFDRMSLFFKLMRKSDDSYSTVMLVVPKVANKQQLGLPKFVDIAVKSSGCRDLHTSTMICRDVVLHLVCADLISSHPRAHLGLPSRGKIIAILLETKLIQSRDQSFFCADERAFTAASLSGRNLACWEVCDSRAVLVFIPMLSTGTSATVPFDFQVFVQQNRFFGLCGFDNCDCYR